MTKPSKIISGSSYRMLLARVRATIRTGKRRVERELTRMYWEVGRDIQRYILKDRKRAPYGEQLTKKMARDLGYGHSTVSSALEFYRANPIFHARGKLTWTHHKNLLTINDPLKRNLLERKAIKLDWTVPQLRQEIRRIKQASGELRKAKPLVPKRGIVGVRKIVKGRDHLAWDLGFTSYRYLKKKPRGYKEPPAKDLFTFKGFVERVVDGDTVWCKIELGFQTYVREKLRLRGVDTPELGTPAGQKAKKYLQKLLPQGTEIVVRTSKSDKFDRYLADLFLGDLFINNALLEAGLARRV